MTTGHTDRSLFGGREGGPWRPWTVILPLVFVVVAGWQSVGAALDPRLIGSHALIYTDAARAWLAGGDPWTVGPPAVVFAGPPTMLLPFVPFVWLPGEVTRWAWVIGDLVVAIGILRVLRLPSWWIAFPPLASAIELGHPELLVLGLLLVPGSLAGLAPVVKPYAALPLVAEHNWRGLAFGAIAVLITAPLLPWGMFMDNLPRISGNLARQAVGDSVFGQPALMGIALLAGVLLGWRRFLWLVTPVLWPSAQPIYKIPSIPMIPPVLALAWAIPIPGMTLVGFVLAGVGIFVAGRRSLPPWIARGLASPMLAVGGGVAAPAAPKTSRFGAGAHGDAPGDA